MQFQQNYGWPTMNENPSYNQMSAFANVKRSSNQWYDNDNNGYYAQQTQNQALPIPKNSLYTGAASSNVNKAPTSYQYPQIDQQILRPSFNPSDSSQLQQFRVDSQQQQQDRSKRSATPDISHKNYKPFSNALNPTGASSNNSINPLNKPEESLYRKPYQLTGGRSMTPTKSSYNNQLNYNQSINLPSTPTQSRLGMNYPTNSPGRSPGRLGSNYNMQAQSNYPYDYYYPQTHQYHHQPQQSQGNYQPQNNYQTSNLFTHNVREIYTSMEVMNKADETLQKSSMLRAKITASPFQGNNNNRIGNFIGKTQQLSTPKYHKNSNGGNNYDGDIGYNYGVRDLINKAEETLKKSDITNSNNKLKNSNIDQNLGYNGISADRYLTPTRTRSDYRLGTPSPYANIKAPIDAGETFFDPSNQHQNAYYNNRQYIQGPNHIGEVSPIIQETKDLITRADKALKGASQLTSSAMKKDPNLALLKYNTNQMKQSEKKKLSPKDKKKFGYPSMQNSGYNEYNPNNNRSGSPDKVLANSQLSNQSLKNGLIDDNLRQIQTKPVGKGSIGNTTNMGFDGGYEEAIRKSMEIKRKNDELKRGEELRLARNNRISNDENKLPENSISSSQYYGNDGKENQNGSAIPPREYQNNHNFSLDQIGNNNIKPTPASMNPQAKKQFNEVYQVQSNYQSIAGNQNEEAYPTFPVNESFQEKKRVPFDGLKEDRDENILGFNNKNNNIDANKKLTASNTNEQSVNTKGIASLKSPDPNFCNSLKMDSPQKENYPDNNRLMQYYPQEYDVKNSKNPYTVEEAYENGSKYFGEKMNQYKHGRGQYYYPNDTLYDGDWEYDKRSGYGILYDKNDNVIYDGEWLDDKYHGNGLLYNMHVEDIPTANNDTDYLDFNKLNNKWLRYEGEFFSGMKHGIGSLYFINGERFSGRFKNDSAHGAGVYYFLDNTMIKGDWENNKFIE